MCKLSMAYFVHIMYRTLRVAHGVCLGYQASFKGIIRLIEMNVL